MANTEPGKTWLDARNDLDTPKQSTLGSGYHRSSLRSNWLDTVPSVQPIPALDHTQVHAALSLIPDNVLLFVHHMTLDTLNHIESSHKPNSSIYGVSESGGQIPRTGSAEISEIFFPWVIQLGLSQFNPFAMRDMYEYEQKLTHPFAVHDSIRVSEWMVSVGVHSYCIDCNVLLIF